VTVWTWGATINRVLVPDRDGRRDNVVVGLPFLADYEDPAHDRYLGATLGRYARCVSGAAFRLDGVEHRLDRNGGDHHFHGGADGFHRRVWDGDCEREDGTPILRLGLISPDGDQGYPGRLHVEASYRLDADDTLTFEYRATTDASTVVGLTNHAYWNLAGRGPIGDHALAVNAERVVPADAEHIPTGSPVPVADTPLDLRAGRRLGTERLDRCYALDGHGWAARLTDPSSGRVMTVVTDQPGLAIHAADGLTAGGEPSAGIALQTGAWPDAPNRAEYPSVRLDPGAIYHHRTTHGFSLSR
jgi:aldose 1-epimerase